MTTPSTSTAISDVVRMIVTRMRGRAGYRSCWEQGDDVAVFHSAEAGLIDDDPVTEGGLRRLLIIADIGDPNRPAEAGQAKHDVATLGTLHAREETQYVHCRSVASSGDSEDGTVQACWDAAVEVIDGLADELDADSSLGLVPTYREVTARFAGVTGVRPYTTEGVVVEIEFDLEVTARL
jgi:hypothetical protein